MRILIRSILTWLLFGVLAAIAVGVATEWFIEVAKDKGLFVDAGERWDTVMSTFAPIITSPWVLYPTVALSGLVVGLWVDTWLRRKEAAPLIADRLALADRIDRVAQTVAEIGAEWTADHSAAWHQETDNEKRARREGKPVMDIYRPEMHNVDRKYLSRYGTLCATEVANVIALSRKYLSLPEEKMWRIQHGVHHNSELFELVIFLGFISASLRHDGPDLPLDDSEYKKWRAAIDARDAASQLEQSGNQSPLSTATETPPKIPPD